MPLSKRVASVAPGMTLPPKVHWNKSGVVPKADAWKLTVAPGITVWLVGCRVKLGGTFTVTDFNDVLLDKSGSEVVALAVATLVIMPSAIGVTVMVMLLVLPAFSVPMVQAIFP